MEEELEFDLDLDFVCKTIQDNNYRNVLLQFPDGLRQRAVKIARSVEERTEVNVMIWGDSCYGACDLPIVPDEMRIDMMVQFGHAEMPNIKTTTPFMFIEARSKIDVLPVLKRSIGSLKKKVGVITTVQHVHKMKEVIEYLVTAGFKVHIGDAQGRITHNGTVLGCNITSATSISSKVDCYLYVGSGNFHPIGVALATQKPVIIADPIQNEVRQVADIKDRLLRQRFGAITKSKDASIFGILVSSKRGQMRMKMAMELKNLARKQNKTAFVLLLDEIIPHKLLGLDAHAYVSCACPRIAIDDILLFDVPVLTPFEFQVVLGMRKWEDYKFDTLS